MSQTYTTLTGEGGLFPAIANAIRGKTGSSDQIKADDFPTEITNIPTGGGGGHVIPSDLPNDGKTRICYSIPEGCTGDMLIIKLSYKHDLGNGTTTIDWGDDTEVTVLDGLGRKTSTHTYATAGEYIVSITAENMEYYFGENTSNTIYGGSDGRYVGMYIKWIVLGNGIKKIASNGLYYLINLQEIRFPATGFTALEGSAIADAKSLKEITFPATLTTIGSSVISSSGITRLEVPAGITEVGGSFAYGGQNIEEVILPDSVTTIGASFYYNCLNLKNVTLPPNLTGIPDTCFGGCSNLQTITIPATVTTIDIRAFQNCYSLHKIKFLPTTPPTVSNSNAFNALPTGCVLSVPTGYLSAYTSAANYPSSSTYTYIEED